MAVLALMLALGMLVVLAVASPARKLRLFVALLLLVWIVAFVNAQIEAVAFGILSLGQALAVLAGAIVVCAVLAGLAVLIAGKWRHADEAPQVPLRLTPGRIAGVVLGYELLYWSAGMAVFPFIAHFYKPEMLPHPGFVAALQVPRALVFLAAAWPWLRTGPRAAPLVLGLAFSILGGVAPLLPDNPYMPADVRLAHGVEVGVSNFLFGLWMGWLFRVKPAA